MVDLQGTNPVTGNDIDTTSPSTWANYLIGGAVVVGSLMFGKWAADTAGEASEVGDTVSEQVMSLT